MKFKNLILIFLSFVTLELFCQTPEQTQFSSLPESDKIMYSLGVMLAEDMKKAGLEKADKSMLMVAIEDFIKGANIVDANTARQTVNKYKATILSKAGKEFLETNSKRAGVVSLPSGLQYEVMNAGPADGIKPKLTDRIRVHYHGTLIDGKVFDSSTQRGTPLEFPLNGVIKGWQEALQLMKVGDKWKIYIPYNLGYGERGSGSNIPGYSTLIFEVELLGIL